MIVKPFYISSIQPYFDFWNMFDFSNILCTQLSLALIGMSYKNKKNAHL